MEISVYQPKNHSKKCLVLIGGSGDNIEKFVPLVDVLRQKIKNFSICTFTFSFEGRTEYILELQSKELEDVVKQLINNQKFKELYLFCTSMGAYATVRLLAKAIYNNKIRKVIMYDPADYYFNSQQEHTWSGSQAYSAVKPVVSDKLKLIKGNFRIDVVHLTLRNYGKSGYIEPKYINRGKDHSDGYPRLNIEMVQSFYNKTPFANRGRYIEESDVPHGLLRDGNIKQNISKVTQRIADLLT